MRPLFEQLDAHPALYWSLAGAATLGWLALLLPLFSSQAEATRPRFHKLGFALGLLLLLLAWRWPFLLAAHEYNSDESHFIAAALTLGADPLYWRAVDGITSGPLNVYALRPLSWLGLPQDFFGARLTGLLLCWGTLLALHRRLAAIAGDRRADLALVPAVAFVAVASEPELVHYSSELVPLFLLSLAVLWQKPRPLLAAFLAGCLPWAKLQAGPLTLVLLAWQLATLRSELSDAADRRRAALHLLVAAVAPTAIIGLLAGSFGEFETLVRRYFLQNLSYVETGSTLRTAAAELFRQSTFTGHVPAWLAGCALIFVVGGGALAFRRQRLDPLFWQGVVLSLTAALCILAPARNFLHYLQFLLVPVALGVGAVVCSAPPGRVTRWLAAIVLLAGLLPWGIRVLQPGPDMLGQLSHHWRHPRTGLAEVVHHWAKPDHRLSVWGWRPSLHVESGLAQGTRDTHSTWALSPGPQRSYYRQQYLADLRRTKPEFFVDAVGRGAQFYTERSTQAHESFPELAQHLRENYWFITDLGSARLYARTDFLRAHPIDAATLRRLLARGREEWVSAGEPETTAAPLDRIDHRVVRVIEPPGQLRWPLYGNERQVSVDFGFVPRAYREGNTDGAELIVELLSPGQPPVTVFQRFLDPRQNPADQGHQKAAMVLPPFPLGAILTIRAANGTGIHAAWDWLYVHGLWLRESPFFAAKQFPGFNRVPDDYASPLSSFLGENPSRRLMVIPPAELTFVANGSERRLSFACGIAEGAYTEGGATDGATFSVEWRREGETAAILFSRTLDPHGRVDDRGDQHCEIALPAGLRRGDRIVLRIGNGDSDAWDWTYLAGLQLD